MALQTKEYRFNELVPLERSQWPSLDMPHLVTDGVYAPPDGGSYMLFMVHTKKDFRPEEGCSNCGSTNLKLDGKGRRRLVHDVMRNNNRVDIALIPPRMVCCDCGCRFMPGIDGIMPRKQMTLRLEQYLRKEVFTQRFTVLEEISGFSRQHIARLLDEEYQKIEDARRQNPVEAPRVLGIDEKHIQNLMRGTLTNIETGRLLDMLPNNKQETMENAIRRFKDWDTNIEVVTMDMSGSYSSWLPKLLPNATLVVDKFHVIQDINRKVTASRSKLYAHRKKKIEAIKDPEKRAHQAAILRLVQHNRRLFNFSMARLSRTNGRGLERMATIIDNFGEYKMLHDLRYTLEYMYQQTTREDAEKVWDEWMELLPPATEKEYKEWCDMYDFPEDLFKEFTSFKERGFQKFKPYILNYFNSESTRFTNATTEGLNSLINEINIEGGGYSFDHLRAKALYAPLVHDHISYGVDLSSIKKWTADDYRSKRIESPEPHQRIVMKDCLPE